MMYLFYKVTSFFIYLMVFCKTLAGEVIFNNKTSCFVQLEMPSLGQKEYLFEYKTSCFVPMYDDVTFEKRYIATIY